MSGKNENKVLACPHLGQEGDPCTYFSYASRWNFCYHSRLKTIPQFDHQLNFCLTDNYIECPVYQSDGTNAFPSKLKIKEIRSRKIKPLIWFLIILAIVSSVLIVLSIPGLNVPGLFNPTQVGATEMPIFQTMTTNSPISIAETSLAQFEQSTFTPLPSVSPILESVTPSDPPHTLDTPIGITHLFVIHRIQEGESIGNLAFQYNTNLQAIQDVNYFLPEPVWIDWLVIIPVETTDVVGLPKFEAQMVVNGDVTIEDLAAIQNLDPFNLKFYNGLPDGYLLSSGEWLLIPYIID